MVFYEYLWIHYHYFKSCPKLKFLFVFHYALSFIKIAVFFAQEELEQVEKMEKASAACKE